MIILKSKEEILIMEESAFILKETLKKIEGAIGSGITTIEIDAIAEKHIRDMGGVPTFKGYGGFPGSICISVDDTVIHGIPSKEILKEGSIVSVDIGVTYKGFCTDAARTFAVGTISEEARRLIQVTEESFFKGIEVAKVGNHLSDISNTIYAHITQNGFSVVRDFVGHGVGKKLHEDPPIPNYRVAGRGPKLRAGMTLAIEPMVNAGHYGVSVLDDGWTVKTQDGCLSAHYENTVAITDEGPMILTI